MNAILLAAGRGERLKPITETRPKPLIPVLCKPLIHWHLDYLLSIAEQLDEVIVVASYMKNRVEEFVKRHSLYSKVSIKVIDQGEELGTGHAVLKGIEALGRDSEVIIAYSDVFTTDSTIYRKLLESPGNVIVGAKHCEPHKYGVLVVGEGGVLKELIEKPSDPPTNIVNAGFYKLRVRDIYSYLLNLKPSIRGEYEFTDAISMLVRSGGRVSVLALKEDWIDVGYPWHLLEVQRIALDKLIKGVEVKGSVEPGASIRGDRVYIGEGSVVLPGTFIEGPVFIGSNVIVGPSARLRPYTVICSGSKVGFSVEVKESLIMENTNVLHLAYIGDSIVCENVNIGAGSITANLRFDEAPVKVTVRGERVSSGRRKLGAIIGGGAKIGVNVSIMPGVKIGSYSWIEPGSIVARDVPSRSFLRVKAEYYIEELAEEVSEKGKLNEDEH
ncbi:MAG: sugar phosphate nucleotidyltransferase [Desulfurococcaceae archaeon]